MQITPTFITSVTLLRSHASLFMPKNHPWKTRMKNRAVSNNIINKQEGGTTFHDYKITICQGHTAKPIWQQTFGVEVWQLHWLLHKNGAIYHIVPEVNLTNHFKCFELSYNAFRGWAQPKEPFACIKMKWLQAGVRSAIGLAYKTSIFALCRFGECATKQVQRSLANTTWLTV